MSKKDEKIVLMERVKNLQTSIATLQMMAIGAKENQLDNIYERIDMFQSELLEVQKKLLEL